MYCANCGKEVLEEDVFCPECGANQKSIPETSSNLGAQSAYGQSVVSGNSYDTKEERLKQNKKRNTTAIIIGILGFLLFLILSISDALKLAFG